MLRPLKLDYLKLGTPKALGIFETLNAVDNQPSLQLIAPMHRIGGLMHSPIMQDFPAWTATSILPPCSRKADKAQACDQFPRETIVVQGHASGTGAEGCRTERA